MCYLVINLVRSNVRPNVRRKYAWQLLFKKNPTTTKSNKENNNTVTTKPTVQPLKS